MNREFLLRTVNREFSHLQKLTSAAN